MRISKYWKAVVAAFTAGGAALGTALEDGTLTGVEVGVIVGAILAGYGFTWAVPNKTTEDEA